MKGKLNFIIIFVFLLAVLLSIYFETRFILQNTTKSSNFTFSSSGNQLSNTQSQNLSPQPQTNQTLEKIKTLNKKICDKINSSYLSYSGDVCSKNLSSEFEEDFFELKTLGLAYQYSQLQQWKNQELFVHYNCNPINPEQTITFSDPTPCPKNTICNQLSDTSTCLLTEKLLLSPYLIWDSSFTGPYQNLSSVVSTRILNLAAAGPGSKAYNHHPLITEWNNEIIIMFSTHDYFEEGPGMYLRWSHSQDVLNGQSWSIPETLFEPHQQMQNNRTLDARILLPSSFLNYNSKLYVLADVMDRPRSNSSIPFWYRNSAGLIAREIKPDWSLGEPFWITAPVAPLPEFQAYRHDSELGPQLLDLLDKPGTRPAWSYWNNTKDLYGEITFEELSTNLCERDEVQISSVQWLRLWRICAPNGQNYKAIQSSPDGFSWSVPVSTNIPDDPSKTIILKLPNNHIAIIGNPRPLGSQRRQMIYFAISDTPSNINQNQIYFSEVYSIYSYNSPYPGPSYPDAIVLSNGKIGVVYSITTSAIQFSSFPIPN